MPSRITKWLCLAGALTMAVLADLAGGAALIRGDRDQDAEWRCYLPRESDSKIEFCYRDDDYKDVRILGSFNGWEPAPMRLDEEEDRWSIRIDLDAGRHQYQFVVLDSVDTWQAIDPGNPEAEILAERGWVSVLVVDDEGLPVRSRHRGRRIAKAEFTWSRDNGEVDILYNRVDGLFLGANPEHLGKERFEPSVRGFVGYGFKSEQWGGGVTILQPLVPDSRLTLRGSAYSKTDYTDQTGIGTDENSLAALFFKKDFRDYYHREGASFSLVFRESSWLRLEGGFRADDYESMEQNADWSFTRGTFPWNPPIDEGTMRSFFAQARIGTRWNRLDVQYEQCGDDLFGGDFEFQKVTAETRSRLRMNDHQHIDMRLRVGANLSGVLPAQKRYVAGGLGTVRGYEYRSLRIADSEVERDQADLLPLGGEQLLLANFEYAFKVDDDFSLIPFFDAGMVWESRDAELDLNDLDSSAGIGFLLDDHLRINLIRPLDRGDRDMVVQLRIERMF